MKCTINWHTIAISIDTDEPSRKNTLERRAGAYNWSWLDLIKISKDGHSLEFEAASVAIDLYLSWFKDQRKIHNNFKPDSIQSLNSNMGAHKKEYLYID